MKRSCPSGDPRATKLRGTDTSLTSDIFGPPLARPSRPQVPPTSSYTDASNTSHHPIATADHSHFRTPRSAFIAPQGRRVRPENPSPVSALFAPPLPSNPSPTKFSLYPGINTIETDNCQDYDTGNRIIPPFPLQNSCVTRSEVSRQAVRNVPSQSFIPPRKIPRLFRRPTTAGNMNMSTARPHPPGRDHRADGSVPVNTVQIVAHPLPLADPHYLPSTLQDESITSTLPFQPTLDSADPSSLNYPPKTSLPSMSTNLARHVQLQVDEMLSRDKIIPPFPLAESQVANDDESFRSVLSVEDRAIPQSFHGPSGGNQNMDRVTVGRASLPIQQSGGNIRVSRGALSQLPIRSTVPSFSALRPPLSISRHSSRQNPRSVSRCSPAGIANNSSPAVSFSGVEKPQFGTKGVTRSSGTKPPIPSKSTRSPQVEERRQLFVGDDESLQSDIPLFDRLTAKRFLWHSKPNGINDEDLANTQRNSPLHGVTKKSVVNTVKDAGTPLLAQNAKQGPSPKLPNKTRKIFQTNLPTPPARPVSKPSSSRHKPSNQTSKLNNRMRTPVPESKRVLATTKMIPIPMSLPSKPSSSIQKKSLNTTRKTNVNMSTSVAMDKRTVASTTSLPAPPGPSSRPSSLQEKSLNKGMENTAAVSKTSFPSILDSVERSNSEMHASEKVRTQSMRRDEVIPTIGELDDEPIPQPVRRNVVRDGNQGFIGTEPGNPQTPPGDTATRKAIQIRPINRPNPVPVPKHSASSRLPKKAALGYKTSQPSRPRPTSKPSSSLQYKKPNTSCKTGPGKNSSMPTNSKVIATKSLHTVPTGPPPKGPSSLQQKSLAISRKTKANISSSAVTNEKSIVSAAKISAAPRQSPKRSSCCQKPPSRQQKAQVSTKTSVPANKRTGAASLPPSARNISKRSSSILYKSSGREQKTVARKNTSFFANTAEKGKSDMCDKRTDIGKQTLPSQNTSSNPVQLRRKVRGRLKRSVLSILPGIHEPSPQPSLEPTSQPSPLANANARSISQPIPLRIPLKPQRRANNNPQPIPVRIPLKPQSSENRNKDNTGSTEQATRNDSSANKGTMKARQRNGTLNETNNRSPTRQAHSNHAGIDCTSLRVRHARPSAAEEEFSDESELRFHFLDYIEPTVRPSQLTPGNGNCRASRSMENVRRIRKSREQLAARRDSTLASGVPKVQKDGYDGDDESDHEVATRSFRRRRSRRSRMSRRSNSIPGNDQLRRCRKNKPVNQGGKDGGNRNLEYLLPEEGILDPGMSSDHDRIGMDMEASPGEHQIERQLSNGALDRTILAPTDSHPEPVDSGQNMSGSGSVGHPPAESENQVDQLPENLEDMYMTTAAEDESGGQNSSKVLQVAGPDDGLARANGDDMNMGAQDPKEARMMHGVEAEEHLGGLTKEPKTTKDQAGEAESNHENADQEISRRLDPNLALRAKAESSVLPIPQDDTEIAPMVIDGEVEIIPSRRPIPAPTNGGGGFMNSTDDDASEEDRVYRRRAVLRRTRKTNRNRLRRRRERSENQLSDSQSPSPRTLRYLPCRPPSSSEHLGSESEREDSGDGAILDGGPDVDEVDLGEIDLSESCQVAPDQSEHYANGHDTQTLQQETPEICEVSGPLEAQPALDRGNSLLSPEYRGSNGTENICEASDQQEHEAPIDPGNILPSTESRGSNGTENMCEASDPPEREAPIDAGNSLPPNEVKESNGSDGEVVEVILISSDESEEEVIVKKDPGAEAGTATNEASVCQEIATLAQNGDKKLTISEALTVAANAVAQQISGLQQEMKAGFTALQQKFDDMQKQGNAGS